MRLAWALLLTGCATTAARTPPGDLNLAADFLTTACRAEPGPAFSEAWLQHEQRSWDFYEALYYADDSERAERSALATELGLRRDELCGHARAFAVVAPGAVAALRPRVAELMGSEPRNPIAFSAALQWTNANVRSYRGAEVLNLNARHDGFRLVSDLVATLGHELIHDAQSRLHDDEALPVVLRSLYSEGAAVFGVSLLFPEHGDAVLGMKKSDLEAAKVQTAAGSAALFAALDGDSEAGRRFFAGGFKDPLLPPRMGYFLGLRIYQRIAARLGPQAAVRIDPKSFGVEARQVLEQLRSN